MLSGIGADSNKTKGIANNLEEVVNGEMGNSPTSNQTLKTGNLNASVDAVNQLSIFHELYQELPSNNELEVKEHEKIKLILYVHCFHENIMLYLIESGFFLSF